MVPDWRQGNPYMEKLAAGVVEQGVDVQFSDYPEGEFQFLKMSRAYPHTSEIHFHWLTRELIERFFWSDNTIKFRIRLFLLRVDLLICRIRGIRLIWTVHNLFEHETLSNERELAIRRAFARFCTTMIAHSESAAKRVASEYGAKFKHKIVVIPHGNYLGHYILEKEKIPEIRERHELLGSEASILFFGGVRRYKGIELLLDAFSKTKGQNLRLIIAGNTYDPDTHDWVLAQCAMDDRIRSNIGFVPEDEVAAYFEIADIVALPFVETLTSGSLILAMGFSKPVILPSHANVLDIPDGPGALFYDSEAELVEILENFHRNDLRTMGAENLREVKKRKWSEIGKATADLYR